MLQSIAGQSPASDSVNAQVYDEPDQRPTLRVDDRWIIFTKAAENRARAPIWRARNISSSLGSAPEWNPTSARATPGRCTRTGSVTTSAERAWTLLVVHAGGRQEPVTGFFCLPLCALQRERSLAFEILQFVRDPFPFVRVGRRLFHFIDHRPILRQLGVER